MRAQPLCWFLILCVTSIYSVSISTPPMQRKVIGESCQFRWKVKGDFTSYTVRLGSEALGPDTNLSSSNCTITLVIWNIQLSDAGYYSLSINTGPSTEVNSTVMLFVYSIPYADIILSVGRNPGFGGDTIELNCSTTSYSLPVSDRPKTYYFWNSSLYGSLRNISSGPAQLRNGDIVPDYSIKNDGKTLTIVSAQFTDNFLCSAQEEGSPYKNTSVNFALTVYGRPRSYDIYPTGRIFNAAPSDSTAMYFSYETNTPLTSHTNWSFVNASRSTAEFPLDSNAFKYYSRIALYFVLGSPSLYGSYSATINNSYGSTTEMFWVLPPGPPQTPSNFSVQYLTSSLILLQWRGMWHNSNEQTVVVRLTDVANNTTLETQYNVLYGRYYNLRNTTLFQSNIQPETSYEASIWSTNTYGSSDVTKLIIGTPKPVKFIVSPSNISIEEGEATINFLVLNLNTTLLRLNVTCCVEATTECSNKSYILANTDTQLLYDILPTGTEYVFDFIVFNTDGYTYEFNLAVAKGVRVSAVPSTECPVDPTDTNENHTTLIPYDITIDVCAFNSWNPLFVLVSVVVVHLGVVLLA